MLRSTSSMSPQSPKSFGQSDATGPLTSSLFHRLTDVERFKIRIRIFGMMLLILVFVSVYKAFTGKDMDNETFHVVETSNRIHDHSQCPSLWHVSRETCQEELPRLLQYCNFGEPFSINTVGVEGEASKEAETQGMKLVHLAILLRHGDRITLNTIPDSIPYIQNKSEYYLSHAKKLLEPISLMKVEYLPENDVHDSTFNSPISSQNILQIPDTRLGPGMLTTIGFMQHYLLGKFINLRYAPFVESISKSSELYVRSTNYDRTIQSVASFLSTLLPKLSSFENIKSKPMTIKTYFDEADELMHGVGLRLSSKNASLASVSSGDTINFGSCAKSARLATEEKKKFEINPNYLQKMSKLFSDRVVKRSASDLADATLPSICHGFSLPCSNLNHQCMNLELAREAIGETDRMYCSRYAGSNGGQIATKLAMYPFLSEVIAKIESHHTAESKITVFSGHDTVIGSVLGSLGVFKDDICKWPPYASRIVYEVYRNQESKLFIRMIFNGVDLTSKISSCQPSNLNSKSKIPFCNFQDFKKQVDAMILPYQTFQEACEDRN